MKTFLVFDRDILNKEASIIKFRNELNKYLESKILSDQLILDELLGIFKQFKNVIIENKCLVNMAIEKLPKVKNSEMSILREQIKTVIKNSSRFTLIKGSEGGVQLNKKSTPKHNNY